MAPPKSNYRQMIQSALMNPKICNGASPTQIKTYIFTNYHVYKGYGNWVDHMLKRMLQSGEVEKVTSSEYILTNLPKSKSKKKDGSISQFFNEHTESERAQSSLQLPRQGPSSYFNRGKTHQAPSKIDIEYKKICKERAEKECFTCKTKGCTQCRKTPEEIHLTSKVYWTQAKGNQEMKVKQEKEYFQNETEQIEMQCLEKDTQSLKNDTQSCNKETQSHKKDSQSLTKDTQSLKKETECPMKSTKLLKREMKCLKKMTKCPKKATRHLKKTKGSLKELRQEPLKCISKKKSHFRKGKLTHKKTFKKGVSFDYNNPRESAI